MSGYSWLPIHTVKALCYRYFSPSKCVDINTIIAAGASGFLLAPAWLPRSKDGGSRQGREAFILTLARHSPVLLLLRNGMHQFALQTAFHIWVYLLMGLPAFIDYISPYLYNAPCLYCKLYQI